MTSVYDRSTNCHECGLLLSVGHNPSCYLYSEPLASSAHPNAAECTEVLHFTVDNQEKAS